MKFSRLKKIGLLVGTVLALTSIQSFGKEWNFESLKKGGSITHSYVIWMVVILLILLLLNLVF